VFEAYGTLGSLQGLLGVFAGLAAWGMGHFGLSNLLEGYLDAGHIRAAFAVFVISTTISFTYQKYAVTLIGLNKVAITNRIDAVFSLLSIGAGVVTLSMGGGIFTLALVMQSFSMLGLIRNRWLLRMLESGRFRTAPSYCWNRQIMGWAWEPTWKSMAGKLANTGLIQASGIIFAKYGAPSEVASYLLANRLLTVAAGLAVTPFFSRIPIFARWLSEGHTERLQKEVPNRIATASVLLAAAILAGAVFVNPLLHLIKSNIPFLPSDLWLVIGAAMLIVNFGQLNASATAIGNHVILYKEQFLTSLVCVGLMMYLTPRFGVWGLVAGMYGPLVGFLTIQSILVGARYLSLNPWVFCRRSFLPVFSIFSVLAVVIAWFHR
jgi:O-antigen/teichoic acid export membrane protein